MAIVEISGQKGVKTVTRHISERSKEGRQLKKEHDVMWRRVAKLKRPVLLNLLHERALFALALYELGRKRAIPDAVLRKYYRSAKDGEISTLRRHMRTTLEWCFHHEVKAIKCDRLKG